MNSVARRALPDAGTTREEFLTFLESRPDERWELIDGAPVMMVGVSIRHSRMVANIHAAIRSVGRRSGCETLFGDTFVGRAGDDRFLLVPDVYVRCGPVPDDLANTVEDATHIVEVLSPGTMHYDRGAKLGYYQSIPTIRQILLVYQNEMRIENWTRTVGGTDGGSFGWEAVSDPASAVPLLGLEGDLAVEDVYEGVDLKTGTSF